MLIDTGGVDIADPSPITRQIAEQARTAIREADLVLFVVDARIGVTPGDEELAQILREAKKPVLVLANKIDDPSQEALALEFHRLGFGEPFPVSGAPRLEHRRPARRDPRAAARASRRARCPLKMSDPGRDPRPSERRQVVALQPPRRRRAHDRVGGAGYDARHDRHDHRARRAHVSCSSTPRAFAASAVSGRGSSTTPSCARSTRPKRADVALVLIDASQGIVEGDITAVEVARKAHCATLIVLAKWDISEVTIEDVRPELQRRLRQRPDFITVSSVSGRGVARLLDKVAELYDRYVGRISTGELNRLLARAEGGAPAAVERRTAASTCSTARRSRRGRRASGSPSTTQRS